VTIGGVYSTTVELNRVAVTSASNIELLARDTFIFSTESLIEAVDLFNVSSVSDAPLVKEPNVRGVRYNFTMNAEDPDFGVLMRSPNAIITANTSTSSYTSQVSTSNVPQIEFSGNTSSGSRLVSDLDYFISLAQPGYEHFRFSVSDSNSTGETFAEIAFLSVEAKPIVSTLVGSTNGYADGLLSAGLLSNPRLVLMMHT